MTIRKITPLLMAMTMMISGPLLSGGTPERITALGSSYLHGWSPDGSQIVFLSFMPEVRADDHPFYKHVYIRRIAIPGPGTVRHDFESQTPEVIAYLYGGQGTINVPGWSPDGKRVVLVSNSGPITD